jgi:hypothetical protein
MIEGYWLITSNGKVLASNPPPGWGIINNANPLTSTTTVYPLKGLYKSVTIVLNITSVSGTFSSGQGLTIVLNSFGQSITINSTPITSPTLVKIVITQQNAYAIIGSSSVTLSGGGYLGQFSITLQISGTSPSFQIDGRVYGEVDE